MYDLVKFVKYGPLLSTMSPAFGDPGSLRSVPGSKGGCPIDYSKKSKPRPLNVFTTRAIRTTRRNWEKYY